MFKLPLDESCLAGMSRIGLLARALDPTGAGKLNLTGATGRSSSGLAGPDQVLSSNGVDGLLRTLPFNARDHAGLGAIALLASLLATIHRTLGVNLLAPQAAPRLTEKLQKICGGGGFRLPQSQGPKPDPSVLLRLTQLSSAALALRGVGVNLFGPNGVRDLQAWLSSSTTSKLRATLSNTPLRMATISSLSRLANVSLAVQSVQSGFNINMCDGRGALKLPALFSQLKTRQLVSLWPAITAGALERQIRLPDPGQVASLNAQKAGLQVVQRATGLNPLDPALPNKLPGLLHSFGTSGACGVVQAAPIHGAQLEGLNRLSSFNSSLEATRNGLGIDLLEKDAGAKLARTIKGLHAQGQPSVGASGDWTEVLRALKRLADIGTAVS